MKCSATVPPEARFKEYDKWCAANAPFAAVCALGKGLRGTAGTERDLFLSELKRRVQPEVLSGAAAEAAASWRRVMQILSIGSKFDEDELLLVLTLRQQIELVIVILTTFGISAEPIDLATSDAELCEIARSSENRRAFMSALASIRRNADPEFLDRWST